MIRQKVEVKILKNKMTKFFIFLFQVIGFCGISFAYDLPLTTAPHKVEFASDEAYFFDDSIPVIIISAQQAKGYEVLSKPIKPEVLLQKIVEKLKM